jgi:diacylglycerol kinase (ATP)
VLVGRFAGVVRAVSPFLAGASGLALRRFVPWSAAGALLWAVTFVLVGFGFSESFAEAGDVAARITLGAALVAGLGFAAVAALRSGGLRGRGRPHQTQRQEGAQPAQEDAQERSRHHVEREMDAQINARERDGNGDGEREGPQTWAQNGDRGGGGERRGAVAGRKRRIVGDGDERSESRIGHRRTRAVERLLENTNGQRRRPGGRGRSAEGERQAATPQVGAQAQGHQQRSLDPPGRQHHEDRRQPGVLEGRSGLDEGAVEVEQKRHDRDEAHASSRHPLLLAVNGRASGIEDPHAYARELEAALEEEGRTAEVVVTESEGALWQTLRTAADSGQRVILAGGDGTLHAAANAPLRHLPELALLPAGRANNVARALGIPTNRTEALSVALGTAVTPLDALRVATPDRFVYAVEAVSAGFHARARAGYSAENSADLRQGLRALVRAVREYRPYRARIEIGPGTATPIRLRMSQAAQIFFSNLPYFGFGFEVDPGADPTDGRFEVITMQARGRARLLTILATAWRGRHLGRRGVARLSASRARLSEPLPLVADALPLGTTTATVTVEPGRLRIASPRLGVIA